MGKSTTDAGVDPRPALRAALRAVQTDSGLPIAFGALVDNGATAELSEFLGTRTTHLHGLGIRAGSGLGGRVIAEGRPAAVDDYRSADSITHDYDEWVTAEGLSAVAAAPFVVRGRTAALIYGATRENVTLGDRGKAALVSCGRRLSMELTVRDEVGRRMREAEVVASASPGDVRDVADLEEIRSLHAELRAVAQLIPDTGLAERVSQVSQRLADVGTRTATAEQAADHGITLSPREIDVISQVALGCTNAETAARLCIKPETAKAYLRGAMSKLGVHTRFEAVVRSRRLGLVP
ncbi:regulatory LuxR family protein [Pseudonocardia sediminis]|uniref:Regulatory LuxR family protein n=1 Tax=Pseudonocardia sediminis TaxID=1397368 RepID=A0A4Q7UR07_PSEST|nr:helix-turn-helix transcriptional regulator [Pseudonocardia sediminis]RZT84125.1 regulatory LuxR family protein [Pseudonocardia sediminis]